LPARALLEVAGVPAMLLSGEADAGLLQFDGAETDSPRI
jgi:hypothetical protein